MANYDYFDIFGLKFEKIVVIFENLKSTPSNLVIRKVSCNSENTNKAALFGGSFFWVINSTPKQSI